MVQAMTEYDARLDIDPSSQIYADVIMLGIKEASKIVEAQGHGLTLNALIGAICAVAAFHVAGVEDARARKSLMREIEKQIPRLVAQQRASGVTGRSIVLYEGRQ